MATRTMKKFLALLLSLMMIAAVFVVPSVAATDDLEVTVHYQRSDSNYDNWEYLGLGRWQRRRSTGFHIKR